MQISKDGDYVRQVTEILGESITGKFDSKATEAELHRQQLLLSGILDHRKWEKMNLSLLSDEAAYQDWLNDTDKSSLLILSGWNRSQVKKASFSWLSQAVIDLTRMLLKDNHVIGYRFCGSEDSVVQTLSNLILQMLEREQCLAGRCSLLDQLSKQSAQTLDVTILQDAFLSVLNVVQDTVYILLDRPELLGDSEERETMMDALLTAVRMVSPGKLKVIVSISHAFWNPEDWIKKCHRRELQNKALLLHIRRDQARAK